VDEEYSGKEQDLAIKLRDWRLGLALRTSGSNSELLVP
jgi:hypothetical protein